MKRNEIADSLWENIENLKVEKKLYWRHIALYLGISLKNLQSYRKHKRIPNVMKLINLSNKLDITLEQLLFPRTQDQGR